MPSTIKGDGRKTRGGTSAATTESAPSTSADSAAVVRAQVFDALHKEMELTEYAIGGAGQKVKKVPRNQLPERTNKRKALEKEDLMEMAMEADDGEEADDVDENGVDLDCKPSAKRGRKRLRGRMAAFEDAVLNSMPLSRSTTQQEEEGNDGDNQDGEEDEAVMKEVSEFLDEKEEDLIGDDEDDDADSDFVESDGDEIDDDASESNETDQKDDTILYPAPPTATTQPAKSKQISTKMSPAKRKATSSINRTKKRLLHRMREFSSHRLAQRHGEAIDAHVRGMSETAVQKLRELAKAAPGAPQVYSSLGMVYDSMLSEVESKMQNAEGAQTVEERGSYLNLIIRQFDLAQKAYASYHVAALLCKRDFVLWEKGGDMASRICQMYVDTIAYLTTNPLEPDNESAVGTEARKGFDPHAGPETWKAERKEWLDHALAAFTAADNIRPPGDDIPCKLAQAHMDVGNYIEALTILSDLRNKPKSDIETSHSFWLLYSDLMMKIGYECKQWNDGTSQKQNVTMKKWLRKNSKTFDWKERRLQALCLALESAAGSEACTDLTEWTRDRADKFDTQDSEGVAKDPPETNGAEKDQKVDEAACNVTKDMGKELTELEAPKLSYEQQRHALVQSQKLELHKFDMMTAKMNIVEGSHMSRDRVSARDLLVEKHRTAIRELVKQSYTDIQPDDEQKQQSTDDEVQKFLPPQASCATVCDIAGLLLNQCVQYGLYEGGVFTAQSVLSYFKARARTSQMRLEKQRAHTVRQQEQERQGFVQPGFGYDKVRQRKAKQEKHFYSIPTHHFLSYTVKHPDGRE